MCQLKFLTKNIKSAGIDVVLERGGGWMGFFSDNILPQNLSTYLSIIFSMNKSLKDENWRYRKPSIL